MKYHVIEFEIPLSPHYFAYAPYYIGSRWEGLRTDGKKVYYPDDSKFFNREKPDDSELYPVKNLWTFDSVDECYEFVRGKKAV